MNLYALKQFAVLMTLLLLATVLCPALTSVVRRCFRHRLVKLNQFLMNRLNDDAHQYVWIERYETGHSDLCVLRNIIRVIRKGGLRK